MRNIAGALGAAVVTLSGSALANPVMVVNELYVEQFPGTPHVQITRNYSSGSSSTTTVTRDGGATTVSFETFPGGSRDLGSGLSNLTTDVGCDCSVTVGTHTYVVANNTLALDVVEASATTGEARAPSAQCDVKCAGSVIPGATGGTTNVGTSSTSTPTGGTTSTLSNGGSTATGGTISNTATTPKPTENDDNDSSGCTVSQSTGGLFPVGVLAVLGLLGLRRRK
jgi:uncharacterized protein (TIGR03382 family)